MSLIHYLGSSHGRKLHNDIVFLPTWLFLSWGCRNPEWRTWRFVKMAELLPEVTLSIPKFPVHNSASLRQVPADTDFLIIIATTQQCKVSLPKFKWTTERSLGHFTIRTLIHRPPWHNVPSPPHAHRAFKQCSLSPLYKV